MKDFKFSKDVLVLAILSLITVLSWIGFEVYRAATESSIPRVTKEMLIPIQPNLDRETIEQLKQSLTFSEEELNSLPVPVVIEPTPSLIDEPEATPSIQSEEATQSGQSGEGL